MLPGFTDMANFAVGPPFPGIPGTASTEPRESTAASVRSPSDALPGTAADAARPGGPAPFEGDIAL